MRLAVVGHAEHITLGSIPAMPHAGDIHHLDDARVFVGGGGGVTFYQLLESSAEVLLYTACGNDDAGRFVADTLGATRGEVHAARRDKPHTRDVVVVTPGGERTIFVVGRPLHPQAQDALPWERLAECDAVYFTAEDPEALKLARAARLLVVTARRRQALVASGVRADVIIGSANDPREASTLAHYPVAPGALVMTEGSRGGRVDTAAGTARFPPTAGPPGVTGGYGAGDSFAGALVYFVALGLPVVEAAARAAAYGASVLGHAVPIGNQRRLPDAA
jgi:ribokinase